MPGISNVMLFSLIDFPSGVAPVTFVNAEEQNYLDPVKIIFFFIFYCQFRIIMIRLVNALRSNCKEQGDCPLESKSQLFLIRMSCALML